MSTQKDQESLVTSQFGPRAAAYVASPVHAQGEDLHYLVEVVRGRKEAHVLDLGCGGGHVSFHVAPEVADVVAYDLSAGMLAAVSAEARRRGFANIACRQGPAEILPFADAEFDFVFCRFSAHHWRDVPQALREARRVLKAVRAKPSSSIPSRRPCLCSIHSCKRLRNAARSLARAELFGGGVAGHGDRGGLSRRGSSQTRRLPLDFASWIARMNTPDLHAQAIRSLQARVAEEVRAHFAVEADGSFTIDVMTLELSV